MAMLNNQNTDLKHSTRHAYSKTLVIEAPTNVHHVYFYR